MTTRVLSATDGDVARRSLFGVFQVQNPHFKLSTEAANWKNSFKSERCVFVNLPTGFANLLFIKRFHLCLITPPTFRRRCQHCKGRTSVQLYNLEKRVRPDQGDDFESVISRNPAALCQQKLVFPTHPNLRGWQKKYKWYLQIAFGCFSSRWWSWCIFDLCRHSVTEFKNKSNTIFPCLEDFFDLFSLAPSTYPMPDWILSNAGSIFLYRRTVRCFLSSDSRPPIARIGWLQQCRVNSFRKWRFCYSWGKPRNKRSTQSFFDYFLLRSIENLWDVWQHLAKEAMNSRGKLTSLTNYWYVIGFRANNRERVIDAFCNFHVNSKQRETNGVQV